MWTKHYDVLIVGGGIAGCALAQGLSTIAEARRRARKSDARPLSVALLERSLAEPDRIVGELLQPGGVAALEALGMQDCLEGIDAVPTKGYCVVDAAAGRDVHIPYPDEREGRSFHHGRFVQQLRKKAKSAVGVEVVEGTVTELVRCEFTHKVIGVRAKTRRGVADDLKANGHANGDASGHVNVHANGHANGHAAPEPNAGSETEVFYADLVVLADGCFSKFRADVLPATQKRSTTKSHFVGAVLEDAVLPIPQHGTVALVKGSGPVLLYQIGQRETRMLVDVKVPLPVDVKAHILEHIVPQLPSALHAPIHTSLANSRLRRMPNTFLPPAEQGAVEGALLLGDSWNMRHPLTGGGMTVALWDAVLLAELLGGVRDLGEWEQVRRALGTWHWRRKGLAGTINILSVALYDLFGADSEELDVLRTGCFKYFERGGDCIRGPISLLSGIAPDPVLLARHFFAVAFYAIWVLFTHPRRVRSEGDKPVFARPRIDEWPYLMLLSVRAFWTACVVFGPLVWSEIRWW